MIKIYFMKKMLSKELPLAQLNQGDFINHTVGEFRISVRGLYIVQAVVGDEAVRENVHQNPSVE